MAQQTAVEWLMNKSLKHTYILNTEYVKDKRIIIELDEFINLFEQAKQMEKEQCKQDYDSGLFDGTMDDVKDRLYKNAEQYYNETYGGQGSPDTTTSPTK